MLPGATEGPVAKGDIGGVRLARFRRIDRSFLHAMAAGAAVVVSVRPETIRLVAPGSQSLAGWSVLPGTVVGSGFLGHTSRYSVRVDDMTLQANVESSVRFANGDAGDVVFSHNEAIGLPR
jgi:ABC-type Fe3+/spermidine/putrescine transport system ATPase subunit